jgi:hypothetical protein
MEVKNAIQIQNGAKIEPWVANSFTQPVQFISEEEKDEEWYIHNGDWLEWQGIKQIREHGRRLLKNYNLARGIIDKADYIPEENPEMADVLDAMISEGGEFDAAYELKFYPIIPTVINVLTTEFAKRNTQVEYRAVDDYSYNELITAKTAEIEAALLEDAQAKLLQKLMEAGLDPNTPEAQQQFDPEALKKLPEIDGFYKKNFRTIGEIWAARQHDIDVERFKMDELEEIAFYDSLVADREFWHFKMYEEDYDVELWNTITTFYHKSPFQKYISKGSYVGNIEILTIADIVDAEGWKMNDEQLKSLETLYPVSNSKMLLDGVQNENYYDASIDHKENLKESLAMKQYLARTEAEYNKEDIVSWILGETSEGAPLHNSQMLRRTTMYWKGQRLLYHLTSIDEGGEVTIDIVDETYIPLNNPIYNNKFDPRKNAETLVYGDHLEPLWQNIVYGLIKIGPTGMPFRMRENSEFTPIYLGVNGNKPGPLLFQFKGDKSVYGAKLPVEGSIFSEHNTKSQGMIELMKPGQIGFNMCNNQIADIMIDEIGTVVALDQNAIPQNSLGESWGKNNIAKAYVTMRDLSILPLDTTLANTESAMNFSHFQTLNLEQSNRLITRMQLANYFKQQTLEVIGFTPQRLGQQIGQIDTAKGIEHAVTGSYAQTEIHFINHSDRLMPRVHSMRTDLAQYYHSKKSSFRLRSSLTAEERTFFELNGIDLMLIDLNTFCSTNANMRAILEEMKMFVKSNNTLGAGVRDVGKILQTKTVAGMNAILEGLEQKQSEQAQAAQAAEKEKWQAELKAKRDEKQMALDHEAIQNEKKRRTEVIVAEIRAAGYGAMQDMNENKQSDFADQMETIRTTEEYQDTMNFNRQKHSDQMGTEQRKLDIEQQKIDLARQTSTIPLQIARENRSKAEIDSAKKNKKQ